VYNALHEFDRNGPSQQRPKSQKDATLEMHLANKETISKLKRPDRDEILRLLEANATKGSGGWMDNPTTWMPPSVYASAWRLRCRAKARSLPDRLQCPGCPKLGVMEQVDFANHVHGCTRVPSGSNATRAHDHLVRHLWKILDANAVTATQEPRGFQSYTCSDCKKTLEGENLRTQVRTHDRTCGTRLYRSGVDLEAFLGRARRMIDVTIAHATSPSLCKTSFDAIVKERVLEKKKRYVDSGMIPADEFVVAVAFSHGAFHDGFVNLLTDIAREAAVDFDSLVRSTRNCVMWGQGAAVDAAFRMAATGARRGRWAES